MGTTATRFRRPPSDRVRPRFRLKTADFERLRRLRALAWLLECHSGGRSRKRCAPSRIVEDALASHERALLMRARSIGVDTMSLPLRRLTTALPDDPLAPDLAQSRAASTAPSSQDNRPQNRGATRPVFVGAGAISRALGGDGW